MKLTADFYSKSAEELAPLLLGKLLCRELDGSITKLRITETEAYCGEADTACHAHKGKTERTKIMYEAGGVAYIYLCYGIHCLLNIVSNKPGVPEAVLIRGVEGYTGPGKLTKALAITRNLNGESLPASHRLWLEDDGFVCGFDCSPRVGIDYATPEYRYKPWRFTLK